MFLSHSIVKRVRKYVYTSWHRRLTSCEQAPDSERCVSGDVGQVELPEEIRAFIRESTGNYGKVKLVLHRNKFWVESAFPDILRALLEVRHARDCARCPLIPIGVLWRADLQSLEDARACRRHACMCGLDAAGCLRGRRPPAKGWPARDAHE